MKEGLDSEFIEKESKYKKAALIKINCPSTGCSATFSMDLKTTQGSGNTKYTIYKGDFLCLTFKTDFGNTFTKTI